MTADLLTPARAAALLGVSTRRVLDFIKTGRLPAQNIGGVGRGARYVIKRADAEHLASKQRQPGRPRKD